MKKVTLRVDVDVSNSSLLKNKLGIDGGCKYFAKVLRTCEEHGIKLAVMFRPLYAMPSEELIEATLEHKHEICLHADNVSASGLSMEGQLLEKRAKVKIEGLAYHGGDLIDNLIFKVFRKEKYLGHPGSPFQPMLAGFKYDATGYADTAEAPTLLNMGKNSIIVFQQHITIDWLPQEKIESLFRNDYTILLFHSNYLWRYGLRKPTMQLLERVFNHIRKSDLEQLTFSEWINRYGQIDH
jgi:hypothetical protein